MPTVIDFKVPKNNANSSLASAITDVEGTLTVTTGDGANFPTTADGDFWVSIDSEILLCTSRATDVLTVTRAEQGTAAAAHSAGAAVELRITEEAITEMQDEIKVGILEGWALDDDLNPTLGTIPINAFVYRVDVWVEEAFNFGNNDDEITVGYDGTVNAYVVTAIVDIEIAGTREHIDEGATGAGATLGTVDSTSRSVEIYVTGTGAAATTGKVYVSLHYIVATAEPA